MLLYLNELLNKFSVNFILFRVVDIDGQRRQISVRRPHNELSQRNAGDDTHSFFFDAVYDWKYVIILLLIKIASIK